MYTTKNQVNGTEARSLDKRLGFVPVNQIIIVTPQNFQIPRSIFQYYLAPTHAPKIRIAKLSIIMQSEIPACH